MRLPAAILRRLRSAALLPLALMAGGAVPAPAHAPSVQELGSVVATLNDWRAILIFSFVINGALLLLITGLIVVIVRMATGRSSNDEATLDTIKENTKVSTEAAAALRAVEQIVARIEGERRS